MKFTNQKNSRAMDGGLADLKHIPQDIEHSRCCVVILSVAQHGRLVAEIEKKMDDENERDFEMPELSDDDDDVPRDTETATAPVNGIGNEDGYASNTNNCEEAYSCCLNAGHQDLGLRVHLEQHHQVCCLLQRNSEIRMRMWPEDLHPTLNHKTHNGNTSCQSITTS